MSEDRWTEDEERDRQFVEQDKSELLWWIGWLLFICFMTGSLGWVVAQYTSERFQLFEIQRICRYTCPQSDKASGPCCHYKNK